MHALAPDCEYAPLAQLLHNGAATPEYNPAEHSEQTDGSAAPVIVENAPAGHAMQLAALAAPEAIEKVPTVQSRHFDEDEAPVDGKNVPAPHCEHILAADCDW